MLRRGKQTHLSIVTAMLVFGLLASCQQSPVLFSGKTMGTSYSVTIAEPRDKINVVNLEVLIEQSLSQVNASMSTYIDDSEISLFNRSRSTQWQPVSKPLVEVLTMAQRISHLSNGAFDVTVGPIVNLWGFGPESMSDKLPTDLEINERLRHIGYRHLAISSDPAMIKKDIPDLAIDVSAIAKGYAVDQIARLLDAKGIANYLVEIGGELRARGVNPDGEIWRVGIETPDTSRSIVQVVHLNHAAIATSGDYRNYREFGGKKYSHGIDPTTGRPITHRVASVSVIAENTMKADTWATAFLILGEERGLKSAQSKNIAAYFLLRKGDEFVGKWSDAFEEYL